MIKKLIQIIIIVFIFTIIISVFTENAKSFLIKLIYKIGYSEYVEEFIKMINILKAHTNIQDDFLKLNLFIDTDKGIDIVDKVNSRTRDEEDEK